MHSFKTKYVDLEKEHAQMNTNPQRARKRQKHEKGCQQISWIVRACLAVTVVVVDSRPPTPQNKLHLFFNPYFLDQGQKRGLDGDTRSCCRLNAQLFSFTSPKMQTGFRIKGCWCRKMSLLNIDMSAQPISGGRSGPRHLTCIGT